MSILLLAIVGVAAGFVATRLMGVNLSTVETIAVGLLGAVVGGFLLSALIAVSAMLFGLIGAILGACALIWVYQRYIRGRF